MFILKIFCMFCPQPKTLHIALCLMYCNYANIFLVIFFFSLSLCFFLLFCSILNLASQYLLNMKVVSYYVYNLLFPKIYVHVHIHVLQSLIVVCNYYDYYDYYSKQLHTTCTPLLVSQMLNYYVC